MSILAALLNFTDFLQRNASKIFASAIFVACNAAIFAGFVVNRDSPKLVGALMASALVYAFSAYKFFVEKRLYSWLQTVYTKSSNSSSRVNLQIWQRLGVCCFFIGFIGWLITDSIGNLWRLQPFIGIVSVFVFGLLISRQPHEIDWRPVIGGAMLQICVGLLILRWPLGNFAFSWFSEKVVEFLNFTFKGTSVVYGFAANPPPICDLAPPFIFTALQIIVFFGSIVSILYYFHIIQSVLSAFAAFMRITLATTAAESLNCMACIFLGTTEATILIEPALAQMSSSEINTIMSVGFACISGSLFAVYIAFGACPVYLLSATMMSAAASLSISKLVEPENPADIKNNKEDFEFEKREEESVIECISNGAVHSSRFVWAIAANLLVYAALLAFVNGVLGYIGELVGVDELSFDRIVGYIMFPLAYLIGVSDSSDPAVKYDETMKFAQLFGKKTVINEFVAYSELSNMIKNSLLKGSRVKMMATYALCGFTNIPMIGAQIGILSSMCPSQKSVFAKVAMRSFICGLLACLLTTCLAGILIENPVECKIQSQHEKCLRLDDLIRIKNAVQNITTR